MKSNHLYVQKNDMAMNKVCSDSVKQQPSTSNESRCGGLSNVKRPLQCASDGLTIVFHKPSRVF